MMQKEEKRVRKPQARIRHCGYGYAEESANDLLNGIGEGERYIDLKVVPLSEVMAMVVLIYECEV